MLTVASIYVALVYMMVTGPATFAPVSVTLFWQPSQEAMRDCVTLASQFNTDLTVDGAHSVGRFECKYLTPERLLALHYIPCRKVCAKVGPHKWKLLWQAEEALVLVPADKKRSAATHGRR